MVKYLPSHHLMYVMYVFFFYKMDKCIINSVKAYHCYQSSRTVRSCWGALSIKKSLNGWGDPLVVGLHNKLSAEWRKFASTVFFWFTKWNNVEENLLHTTDNFSCSPMTKESPHAFNDFYWEQSILESLRVGARIGNMQNRHLSEQTPPNMLLL